MIRNLPDADPELYKAFVAALRGFDAARLFLANSGRYPFTGRGESIHMRFSQSWPAMSSVPEGIPE